MFHLHQGPRWQLFRNGSTCELHASHQLSVWYLVKKIKHFESGYRWHHHLLLCDLVRTLPAKWLVEYQSIKFSHVNFRILSLVFSFLYRIPKGVFCYYTRWVSRHVVNIYHKQISETFLGDLKKLTVCVSWTVQPKFFNFIFCNSC